MPVDPSQLQDAPSAPAVPIVPPLLAPPPAVPAVAPTPPPTAPSIPPLLARPDPVDPSLLSNDPVDPNQLVDAPKSPEEIAQEHAQWLAEAPEGKVNYPRPEFYQREYERPGEFWDHFKEETVKLPHEMWELIKSVPQKIAQIPAAVQEANAAARALPPMTKEELDKATAAVMSGEAEEQYPTWDIMPEHPTLEQAAEANWQAVKPSIAPATGAAKFAIGTGANLAADIVNAIDFGPEDKTPEAKEAYHAREANINSWADWVNNKIGYGSRVAAKAVGEDPDAEYFKTMEMIGPFLTPLPVELGVGEKMAGAVSNMARMGNATAKTLLPYAGKIAVAGAAGLAATKMGIPSQWIEIGGALAGYPIAKSIGRTIVNSVKNLDVAEVAKNIREMVQLSPGGLDAAERAAKVVSEDINRSADRVEGWMSELSEADKAKLNKKRLNTDGELEDVYGADHLDGAAKKIRLEQESMDDLNEKLEALYKQTKLQKFWNSASLTGANIIANTGIAAGVGGLIGATAAPSGMGAQGFAGGAAFGAPFGLVGALGTIRGMRALRVEHGDAGLREMGPPNLQAEWTPNTTDATKDYYTRLAGLARGLGPAGSRIKILQPENFLRAREAHYGEEGAVPAELTPQLQTQLENGFVGTDGDLYLNADRLPTGVGGHEISHPLIDEFVGGKIRESDPELFDRFFQAYNAARGFTFGPNGEVIPPEGATGAAARPTSRQQLQKEILAEAGRLVLQDNPLGLFYGGERGGDVMARALRGVVNHFLPGKATVDPLLQAPITKAQMAEMKQLMFKAGERARVRRFLQPGGEAPPAGGGGGGGGGGVGPTVVPPIVPPPTPPTPQEPQPAPVQHPIYADIIAKAEDAERQKWGGKGGKKAQAAITRAGVEDAAQKHAAAVGPDSDLITWRPSKFVEGEGSISGQRLDPENDPFHKELLRRANLSPEATENLNNIEANIGRTITLDYAHAPEEGLSLEERKAARAVSGAPARVAGEAAREKRPQSFVPTGIKFTPVSQKFAVDGFLPDTFLHNAKEVIDWAKTQKGMTTYDDVNDPLLVQHLQQWTQNHENGFTAGGNPIQGTPKIPVEQTPGYTPHVIPKDYADQINAMMGDISARTGKTGLSEPQKQLQALAAVEAKNSPYFDPVTGETNKVRALMKRDLPRAFDTLRPELMDRIRMEPVSDAETLRPSGFTGDRGQLGLRGLPRREFTAAGFMPATRVPEARPVTEEDAARYVDRVGVPPDRQEEARNDIQNITALNEEPSLAKPYEAAPEAAAPSAPRRRRGARVLRQGEISAKGFEALTAGEPAAVGEALAANRNRLSIVIPELVRGERAGFDIRGTTVAAPVDFAMAVQSIRSPWKESLKVAAIDPTTRQVIGSEIAHIGTTGMSLAYPADIFRILTLYKDKYPDAELWISHNHPSGDPSPSPQDIALHDKLLQTARMAGVKIADHVVTDGRQFYSLERKEFGDIPEPIKQPWEVKAQTDMPKIDSPDALQAFVGTLRADDPNAAHIFYIGTRMRLIGLERVRNGNEFLQLRQQIMQGIAREGAFGIALDLPESPEAAGLTDRFVLTAKYMQKPLVDMSWPGMHSAVEVGLIPPMADQLKTMGEPIVAEGGGGPQLMPATTGFYTKSGRIIDEKMPNAADSEQVKALLRNNGVGKNEMEWLGLNDLPKGKITKDEVQQWIAGHTPEMTETTLGGRGGLQPSRPARYAQYALPGGENYREILYNLPYLERAGFRSPHFQGAEATNLVGHLRVDDRRTSDGNKMLFLEEAQSDWGQAIREEGVQGPVDPKSLDMVEDEGQRSFTDPKTKESFQVSKWSVPFERQARQIAAKFFEEQGAADMPFKGEAWKKLLLRQAIKTGVAEGKDSIGWTTGAQQNRRYNLSKMVSSIDWNKGLHWATSGGITREIEVFTHDRGPNSPELYIAINKDGKILEGTNSVAGSIVGKHLSDVLGKGISDQIMTQDKGTLSGKGLDLGGEGMKGFYDKELVNIANDIGKKFGAKVQDAQVPLEPSGWVIEGRKVQAALPGFEQGEAEGAPAFRWKYPDKASAERMLLRNRRIYRDYEFRVLKAEEPETGETVHELPITPQMRESVETQGQLLFMPSTHPDAIAATAVKRVSDDKVFPAISNPRLYHHMLDVDYPEELKDLNGPEGHKKYVNGYVNNKGEFLDKSQASEVGKRLDQIIKLTQYEGEVQSNELRLMPATQTDSPAFKQWFRDSKVVDENGKPLVVYHGTTHDFSSFDPERANVENDWGKAAYFSNDPKDIEHNYAGMGPDLTNRVERHADSIHDEVMDLSPEELMDRFGVTKSEADLMKSEPKYGSPEYDERKEIYRGIAAKEIAGTHGGATMPVFLKMSNPLELGGTREPYWSLDYDEATGGESGDLVRLHAALKDATSPFYEVDGQQAFDEALEKVGIEGGKASAFIDALRHSDGLQYAVDENGDLASTEILRRTVENMGYDGVVDRLVNKKFGSEKKVGKAMEGMTPDTVHYIAFDPTQIKSAIANVGTFDPRNPNISLMPATRTGGGHMFYSPNEGELNFDQALMAFRGPSQETARKIGADINDQLGLTGKTYNGIGDWSDGAENSVIDQFTNPQDFDELRYNAAVKGKMLNQKSVLAFLEHDDGEHALFSVTVPERDLPTIRAQLDDAGLQFRTLVPQAKDTQIHIFSKDPEADLDALQKFANVYIERGHDIEAQHTRGTGEFVGEADTREEAQGNYAKIIEAYERDFPNRRHYAAGAGMGDYGPEGQIAMGQGQLMPATRPTEATRSWEEVARYLTPEQLASVGEKYRDRIVEPFLQLDANLGKSLDYAQRGAVGRKWYQGFVNAIHDMLGSDDPMYARDPQRFAALMAALSANRSVSENVEHSLMAWALWEAQGRPQDAASLEDIIHATVPAEAGSEDVKSSLPAWIPNSFRALTAEDPVNIRLSGPKVHAFYRNLIGDVNTVTVDRHMAIFGYGTPVVGQRRVKIGGENIAIESFKNLAMQAHIRKVADLLTEISGETWTPAETQAAIWTHQLPVQDLADKLGITPEEFLGRGDVVPRELLEQTPSATLLQSEKHQKTIKRLQGLREENIRRAGTADTGAGGKGGETARQTEGGEQPFQAGGIVRPNGTYLIGIGSTRFNNKPMRGIH